MPSTPDQAIYDHAGFSRAMEAQVSFAQQFDLANPEKAMSSYQRLMHQHTKQQFDMATASTRRRSPEAGTDIPSLSSESSRGSMSSTAS